MTTIKRTKTRDFTLVELLVVIVIISIILSLTAPAFTRIMVGNSVDSAARMVSSQLMLARAEAIARRKYVAVIMPGSSIQAPTTSTEVYNSQSFRTAYVEPDSGDDFKLTEWVPGTQWSFLPKGALIAALDSDNSSLKQETDPDDATKKIWVPKGDAWTPEDGSSITSVKEDSVKVIEGATNDTSIRAVVFKPNGRTVKRMFITVMEGICADNDSSIERKNTNNIRVMEINAYTGQVQYIY